eukprot:Pgem_evm1s15271
MFRSTQNQKLSVGIVGGGLVGSALALYLQKQENIVVQIFEMRENLAQRSGSVALMQA